MPRWRASMVAVVAGGACVAVVASLAVGGCGSSPKSLPPIGIVSSVGLEQAPVLAGMDVESSETIEDYKFYVGTRAGKPVISVFAGEETESTQFAAHLLATHFHPRAMLF